MSPSEGATLVTGYPGFIGKRLVEQLAHQSRSRIYALVQPRFLDEARSLASRVEGAPVEVLAGDVTDLHLGLSGEEVARRLEALAHAGAAVAIYDAALLIENGLHRGLDGVIVVSAPEAVQRSRLAARDGLDDAAITARLAAQLPLADKRAHATWVVDNGGTRDETRAQVRKIWEEIRRSE